MSRGVPSVLALAAVVVAGCPSPTENVVLGDLTLSPVEIIFPSVQSPPQTVTAFPVSTRGAPITIAITWSSSAPSVASVQPNSGNSALATVTAVAAGNAAITASASGTSRQIPITVRGTATLNAVNPSPVTALGLNEPRVLTAQVTADAGVSNDVTWSSSNSGVASVQKTGALTAIVTGVAVGSADVTATLSADASQRRTVPVSVVRVLSIAVAPTQLGLQLGQQGTFTATTNPAGAGVQWSSSNTAAATVNASGQVTTVSCGLTNIRAQAHGDANVFGQAPLTVNGRLTSFAIAPNPAPAIVLGLTLQLTPSFVGDACTDRSVTYSSSNPAVVVVSASGVITAVGPGSAQISVTPVADPSKVITLNVNVTGNVRSVTVAPPVSQVSPGAVVNLTATVDADAGVSQGVTWTTSNLNVATVSASGVVTAVGVGGATITATSVAKPSVSGTATVNVGRVTSITVNPAARTVLLGGTGQLTLTVVADPGVSTTVTWSTSNAGIATVSTTGLVTGVGIGQATITARSVVDNSKFGTSVVTVGRVISLTVTPAAPTLAVGAVLGLLATITADPGMSAVIWATNTPAVATVTQGGVVTAVARGNAAITVTSVADPTKVATAIVTVIGVVSVVVAPRADSLRIGWTRQFNAVVTVDPTIAATVTWASNTPTVAAVNAAGLSTAVALGVAAIRATSTADPAKKDSAVVKVMTACDVPWPHVLGSVFNGVINASSCNGNMEHIGFTLGATTQYTVSSNAAYAYGVFPLAPNAGWSFGSGGTITIPIIAPAGALGARFFSQGGATGPFSFTTAIWNLTGYCFAMIATGISSGNIPLTTSCGYSPPGTVGTFYAQTLYLNPGFGDGENFSLTVTATGFEPRIDLYRPANTLATTATSPPGSNVVTLNHTVSAGTGGGYRAQVTSKVAGATGFVRLTFTGPGLFGGGGGAGAVRVVTLPHSQPPGR